MTSSIHVAHTHTELCMFGLFSSQVDDLRGSPLIVGTLEEIIDEK